MTKPENYVPFLELKTSSSTRIIPFDVLTSLRYNTSAERITFYIKDSGADFLEGYSTTKAAEHIEFFKYYTYQRLTQGVLS